MFITHLYIRIKNSSATHKYIHLCNILITRMATSRGVKENGTFGENGAIRMCIYEE